jgi:diguanylate cyclase (GGDEF)-like protein
MGVRLKVLVGVALFAIVALLDVIVDPRYGISLLYVLPVIWVQRQFTLMWGLLSAAGAALTWAVIDIAQTWPDTDLAVALVNTTVRLGVFVVIVFLDHGRSQAIELAVTDPLTEMPNRRGLVQRAQRMLRDIDRGQPLVIAFLDLDGFKRLNDTQGHAEGDKALRAVARVLKQRVRETDVSARVGGDEFVVLLRHTDEAGARRVAEELADSIRQRLQSSWAIDITVGTVFLAESPESIDAALSLADELLYHGKRGGGGRLVSARWSSAGGLVFVE